MLTIVYYMREDSAVRTYCILLGPENAPKIADLALDYFNLVAGLFGYVERVEVQDHTGRVLIELHGEHNG